MCQVWLGTSKILPGSSKFYLHQEIFFLCKKYFLTKIILLLLLKLFLNSKVFKIVCEKLILKNCLQWKRVKLQLLFKFHRSQIIRTLCFIHPYRWKMSWSRLIRFFKDLFAKSERREVLNSDESAINNTVWLSSTYN